MTGDAVALLAAALLIAGICVAYWRAANTCTATGCRTRTPNGLCDRHLDAAIRHGQDPSEDDCVMQLAEAEIEHDFMRGVHEAHGAYTAHVRHLADECGIPVRRASQLLDAREATTAAHKPSSPPGATMPDPIPASVGRATDHLVRQSAVDLATHLATSKHWRRAVCLDHPYDAMFPDNGDVAAIAVARNVCTDCPLRIDCLAGALDRDEQHGVFGGYWMPDVHRSPRVRRAALAEIATAQAGAA